MRGLKQVCFKEDSFDSLIISKKLCHFVTLMESFQKFHELLEIPRMVQLSAFRITKKFLISHAGMVYSDNCVHYTNVEQSAFIMAACMVQCLDLGSL